MAGIPRRSALRLIGGTPLALGFGLGAAEAQAAGRHAARAVSAAAAGKAYTPRFFTAHEWRTVRVLVDLVIPRDERSGGATDAGVPEFMDFIMTDPKEDEGGRERRQTAMRGGLAWVDAECRRRFGPAFADCTDAQRRALLDDIAYTKKGTDEERPGTAFFGSFRDLTASGFWTSRMGIEDLGYAGNTATVWEGPPAAVLRKLGLEEER